MARGRTERLLAARFVHSDGETTSRGRTPDEVLVEEPLEIRLGEELVATTMRTPGHDFDLAVGFLWAEGFISAPPARVRYCATGSAVGTGFNVVTVEPAPDDHPACEPRARLGVISSSCGICGSEQVDDLLSRLRPLTPTPDLDVAHVLAAGPASAELQELFGLTGGSHAAAALDLAGEALGMGEDIGRHNAVDKLVGSLLLQGSLPTAGDPRRAAVLWVSGRASFELVEKAWAAGFSALVAGGAVSSLAVETAERAGLVLCGFARSDRVTVYAGAEVLERGGS